MVSRECQWRSRGKHYAICHRSRRAIPLGRDDEPLPDRTGWEWPVFGETGRACLPSKDKASLRTFVPDALVKLLRRFAQRSSETWRRLLRQRRSIAVVSEGNRTTWRSDHLEVRDLECGKVLRRNVGSGTCIHRQGDVSPVVEEHPVRLESHRDDLSGGIWQLGQVETRLETEPSTVGRVKTVPRRAPSMRGGMHVDAACHRRVGEN